MLNSSLEEMQIENLFAQEGKTGFMNFYRTQKENVGDHDGLHTSLSANIYILSILVWVMQIMSLFYS